MRTEEEIVTPARKKIAAHRNAPDLARLLDIVSSFSRQTVTVLGDFVVDEYVTGEISRVSREAPVLILRQRQTEMFPGGGANAVNNLVDLGAKVLPVGAVGGEPAGDALLEYFRRKRIDTSGLVRVRGWTTTRKTRFLARWAHTARQQVLRVDHEAEDLLPRAAAKHVLAKFRARLGKSDATIISDYGAGSVSPTMVRNLRPPRAVLDSRYQLLDYRGCGFLAATPNEPELEAAYHVEIDRNSRKLSELGESALAALGFEALLVTRGKDGMVLFERGKAPHEILVHGSEDAVDVTGAGDTVIAAFTLALAAGATFAEAAELANFAGGIVVMKRGTATVTQRELEVAIRNESTARA